MTWYEHLFGILALAFIAYLPLLYRKLLAIFLHSEAAYIAMLDSTWNLWRRLKEEIKQANRSICILLDKPSYWHRRRGLRNKNHRIGMDVSDGTPDYSVKYVKDINTGTIIEVNDMIKSLLHEVMEVMGKTEPDAVAVDMASEILKFVRAQEMLNHARFEKARVVPMQMIARGRKNGAFECYQRILERRNNVNLR